MRIPDFKDRALLETKRNLLFKDGAYHKMCMGICPDCKGTGLITHGTFPRMSWDGISYCDECAGLGLVDWVKALRGIGED